MNFKDLTGKKFNKLLVLERVENDKKGRVMYKCKCDCGNFKIIRSSSIISGNTKSCGCAKGRKNNNPYYGTRLYSIWSNMKNRCMNPKYKKFNDYGGRGINVCNKWLKFEYFKNWALSNGYADNLQIDRIDNNKGYNPNNCRFITPKLNSSNKRNNLIYEYNNQIKTLKQWSESLNIDYLLLYNRIILRNWSFEKAITTPKIENRRNKNAKL